MLSDKEFERLQKLACIMLNQQEKEKLSKQLTNIIHFLDQLKNIGISQSEIDYGGYELSLRTLSGINVHDDCDLMQNIQHRKLNNNIIIKSVLN